LDENEGNRNWDFTLDPVNIDFIDNAVNNEFTFTYTHDDGSTVLRLYDVSCDIFIPPGLVNSDSGLLRVSNGIFTDSTITASVNINFETIVGSPFWDPGVDINTGIIKFCARLEVQSSDVSVRNFDETAVVGNVDLKT
jgi:hypothetical protein